MKKPKNHHISENVSVSIDQICAEILKVSLKMRSIATLFMCASTTENGLPDLDEKFVGLGEILRDYSDELNFLESQIGESIGRGKKSIKSLPAVK